MRSERASPKPHCSRDKTPTTMKRKTSSPSACPCLDRNAPQVLGRSASPQRLSSSSRLLPKGVTGIRCDSEEEHVSQNIPKTPQNISIAQRQPDVDGAISTGHEVEFYRDKIPARTRPPDYEGFGTIKEKERRNGIPEVGAPDRRTRHQSVSESAHFVVVVVVVVVLPSATSTAPKIIVRSNAFAHINDHIRLPKERSGTDLQS